MNDFDSISQPHQDSSAQLSIARLCEQDGRVLDALLEARARGLESGPLPPESAQRAERLKGLLNLLDQMGEEQPPEDLVSRTTAGIDRVRQQERFARQIDMLRQSKGVGRLNLRAVAAVAALALIGGSLLLPTLARTHHEVNRIACAANVQQIGMAMGQYATDFGGMMPRVATASRWPVPMELPARGMHGAMPSSPANMARMATSHDDTFQLDNTSASLFQLIRSGYSDADTLRCPSYGATPDKYDADAIDFGGSKYTPYAFQAQPMHGTIRLEMEPRRIVLADRNPLACDKSGRVRAEENRNTEIPSHSHPIEGQNVLHGDGTVVWLVRPITTHRVGGHAAAPDNIWVPNDVTLNLDAAPVGLWSTRTPIPAQGFVDVFLTQ